MHHSWNLPLGVLHPLRDLQRHLNRHRERKFWMSQPISQVTTHALRPSNIFRNYIRLGLDILHPIGMHNERMLFQPHPNSGFLLEQCEHALAFGETTLKRLERAWKLLVVIKGSVHHAHRSLMNCEYLIPLRNHVPNFVTFWLNGSYATTEK